jgi:hypothetical protein
MGWILTSYSPNPCQSLVALSFLLSIDLHDMCGLVTCEDDDAYGKSNQYLQDMLQIGTLEL